MSDGPAGLTHFDERGAAPHGRRLGQARDRPPRRRPRLGDDGARDPRARRDGGAAKGDVLAVARIAGIMAAKRTADLIPLCHPLALSKVARRPRRPTPPPAASTIEATVATTGPTGVEMEALTAVSVAALTVYDMLKAVDRGMVIGDIRLALKEGGKSGRYEAP